MHAANGERWSRTDGTHLSALGVAVKPVHLVAQALVWGGIQRFGKTGRVERCRGEGEDLRACWDQGKDGSFGSSAVGDHCGGEAVLVERRYGAIDIGGVGHLLKTCC